MRIQGRALRLLYVCVWCRRGCGEGVVWAGGGAAIVNTVLAGSCGTCVFGACRCVLSCSSSAGVFVLLQLCVLSLCLLPLRWSYGEHPHHSSVLGCVAA